MMLAPRIEDRCTAHLDPLEMRENSTGELK